MDTLKEIEAKLSSIGIPRGDIQADSRRNMVYVYNPSAFKFKSKLAELGFDVSAPISAVWEGEKPAREPAVPVVLSDRQMLEIILGGPDYGFVSSEALAQLAAKGLCVIGQQYISGARITQKGMNLINGK